MKMQQDTFCQVLMVAKTQPHAKTVSLSELSLSMYYAENGPK